MKNKSNLRIHPAIGIARVGNSDDYYLGPETLAAMPTKDPNIKGGLPIKKGTEDTPIDSSDLRDDQHQLKKQAARFKIYQYQESTYTYPSKQSEEVTIGSMVDGKKVKDIVWTVHLANKKANCWVLDETLEGGIDSFGPDKAPPLRNLQFGKDASSLDRIQKLVIDAGPRAIAGTSDGTATFEKKTTTSYADANGKIVTKDDYPILYPANDADNHEGEPSQPITYLGELKTDDKGRLIVLGGKGLACRFDDDGNYCPVPPTDKNELLDDDVNNDNWLDDTADGPVTAILLFEDNSTRAIEIPAWVVSTDPSYAPQTPNAISLWDDAFSAWIEDFGLMPAIFKNGEYQADYQPDFQELVFPMFNAAHMQMWNTSLNPTAFKGHKSMVGLGEKPPGRFNIFKYMRKPDNLKPGLNAYSDVTKITQQMPLALGDARKSFLTVSQTQYFFLQQWQEGKCEGGTPFELTAGEYLDKAILFNCLGGRFSPGIDMTFIIRDEHLYNKNWQDTAVGPFRMNAKTYDYATISDKKPAVGVGYEPKKDTPVEPGDICKFMAIPWHTDYNSCATHTPFPNPNSPNGKLTEAQVTGSINPPPNVELYWSWPAQRPVSVYTYKDLQNSMHKGRFYGDDGIIPAIPQRFSLRGPGTNSDEVKIGDDKNGSFDSPMMQVGRFQDRVNILLQWQDIGFVVQSAAIKDFQYDDKELYLEVESNFEKDESNLVGQFPTEVLDPTAPPESESELG